MKGFGTHETELIGTLARVPDAVVMTSLRRTYDARFNRDLLKDVAAETSGYFRETLEALVRGPLAQDVHCLYDALHGAGTKEAVLNDVLLGRSNADLRAIAADYHHRHRTTLESAVRGDLSAKTERLFAMVLAAQRAEDSAPVMQYQLDQDVSELHRATEGKMGTDELAVCHIFAHRSDGQLRAVSAEFMRRYQRPLEKVISSEFSFHMKDALLRMLAVAEDRAMADAIALEDTVKGPGTKDRLLVNRTVRLHWNKQHLQQVKGAYRHKYKKELAQRIKGDTSGHYEAALVAIVGH